MATRGWEHATPMDTRHRRQATTIGSKPRSKYGAVKTMVDGIVFASKREAARYEELRFREKAGLIADLVLQPRIPLLAASVNNDGDPCWVPTYVAEYVADFRYRELATQRIVFEDVKGFKTPLYRLKKKFAEACTGISITEVR